MRAALAAAVAAVVAAGGAYPRYSDFAGQPYSVTYDNRSLFLNGERALFLSAGFHYPRFTQGQWDDVFLKAKADGFNQIQTYVFWNQHQPKPDEWNFDGVGNLTLFLEKAKEYDMFVNFRIGPYVCAEFQFGGYPAWLTRVANLTTRSSNAEWEMLMSEFLLKIVSQYRSYFADRGGPIVLAQVENELHTNDQAYIDFCGELVTQTNTSNPWEMCNGASAANTINSCNGGDCTWFIESNGQNGRVLIDQPALWTENWIDWFQSWGDSSAEWAKDFTGEAISKAQGLLKWFSRGGSHFNWYMYAGGNHFARNAGSSMLNAYYVGSPLISNGLSNLPVRGHLANLLAALIDIAPIVINAPAQLNKGVNLTYAYVGGSWQPANNQHQAFVYSYNGQTAAFIENDDGHTVVVSYNGQNYTLPGASVTIIAANGTATFNSAQVPTYNLARTYQTVVGPALTWQTWQDTAVPAIPAEIPAPTAPRTPWVGSAVGAVLANPTPFEAVNFTEYDTEWALYSTAIPASQIPSGGSASLTVSTARAMAINVFLNGALAGSGYELSHSGGGYTMTITVALDSANPAPGAVNVLTLVTESLGIDNGAGVNNGADPSSFSSGGYKGIISTAAKSVVFGGMDITANGWTMQAGLVGEAQNAAAPGVNNVAWSLPATTVSAAPLTWFRTTFETPAAVLPWAAGSNPGQEVNVTLNLNVGAGGGVVSRGRFYVNGFDLGRYWSKMCGSQYACQQYYSIPADLLLPAGSANTLVFVDVEGVVNASAIELVLSYYAPPPPCGAATTGSPVATVNCGSNGASVAYSFSPSSANPGYGQYVLQNGRGASLCLGVNGTNPSTNTPAVAFVPCNPADTTQLWSQVADAGELKQLSSGNCADIPNQDSSWGLALDIWTCNAGSNQEWSYDSKTGTLVSSLNSGCLGVCN